ncbi:FAD-dependent oxidoreductase [Bacillus sp. FJAT-49705]|uniref:Aerobic glycerol-3-phosphate dehydrogenase n=1 Tax=Cytobacillus citreus TaxID=2833586 RepID=A0ABS5NZK1_9BACI|nr:FAD-dependent oxidoreductase [Cytobacillus citreus]MBS4193262.1 FAD-dependent oxidoreductase [Cytobacillus citreus]
MSEFSFTKRERWMKEVDQKHFDVLIVGGGITGIGTALDAVTRGMSVALMEQIRLFSCSLQRKYWKQKGCQD